MIVEVGEKWKDQFKSGQKFAQQPAVNYKGSLAFPGYSYEFFGGACTYRIIPHEVMELGAVSYGIQYKNKPKRIVVTDISDEKIKRAKEVIPEETAAKNGVELQYVNTAAMADLIKELMDITEGHGFDGAFVYIPNHQVVEMADNLLAFDEQIEVGMMMETPASVLLAEEFAKEADFFSIGTNDLTQYLLAVDRGNKKVADRYDYMHPAVVNAIRQIINAGHKEQIKVGMYGKCKQGPRKVEKTGSGKWENLYGPFEASKKAKKRNI